MRFPITQVTGLLPCSGKHTCNISGMRNVRHVAALAKLLCLATLRITRSRRLAGGASGDGNGGHALKGDEAWTEIEEQELARLATDEAYRKVGLAAVKFLVRSSSCSALPCLHGYSLPA